MKIGSIVQRGDHFGTVIRRPGTTLLGGDHFGTVIRRPLRGHLVVRWEDGIATLAPRNELRFIASEGPIERVRDVLKQMRENHGQ